MAERTATLYRMKLPDHECPFGLLALRMLKDADFQVEDRLLTSREEVEEFKSDQGVSTTPIIFIDDERIDGSEQLAEYLESVPQD
jgi:glutaredoxin